MAADYSAYKNTIKQGHQQARTANSIDEALEIQAAAYASALETLIGQLVVSTNVVTSGSPSNHTGTGTGTVS